MKYVLRYSRADGSIDFSIGSLRDSVVRLYNSQFDKRYKLFVHYEGFYYDITDIVILCYSLFGGCS